MGRPGGPRAPGSFQSPRGCGSERVTLPRDILYICVYSTYFIKQVRKDCCRVCGRPVGGRVWACEAGEGRGWSVQGAGVHLAPHFAPWRAPPACVGRGGREAGVAGRRMGVGVDGGEKWDGCS